MELPAQLKANRERLGFSQEALAKRIYVSRQTISNWETGKTYPDAQSLLLLSNLFDVSVDELLKGDVQTMEKRIAKDAQTLKHLSWAMIGFITAALASGGVAIILRDVGPMTEDGISIGCMIALLLAGALFLCGFAAAVWAEVLKRQNDIITYKEIVAFEKGIPVDDARDDGALSRKHPVVSTALKVFSGAIFGLVAALIFTIIAKYIRDFIFAGLA